MKHIAIARPVFLLGLAACFGRLPAPAPGDSPSRARADAWLRGQPIICGEIQGRVQDELTGRPVRAARVSLDSLAVATSTNADGEFRIGFHGATTRGGAASVPRARLTVRAVGYRSLDFILDGDAGYVLAIGLTQRRIVFDAPPDTTAEVSTIGIKQPGYCKPAA